MNTHFYTLILAAILLGDLTAKADDYAWGSTTANSVVLIDATTGLLQSLPYNGVLYTNFPVVNSANNNGLSNPVLAQTNGTLYVLDGNGALYTINTTLVPDRNNNPCFKATIVNNSVAVNNIQGAVFISTNLLDISSGQSLYRYNLTTQVTTLIGSFSNANISGLAYNGSLYGVQFSPSPGSIDLVSGVNLSILINSSFQGANGQSCMFAGSSLLYLFDGNQAFYSYDTVKNTLTSISNNFKSAQGNIRSLTPTSATGGSGTPTPTPTPTPTATPTPTPTPTATPKFTITGSLTVTAFSETTPQGDPECAPSFSYSVGEISQVSKADSTASLGIYRYYQTTTNGTFSAIPIFPLVLATAAVPPSTVWAWGSGTSNSHAAIAYVAGQVGTTGTPFYYGREIIQLVYTPGPGNGTPILVDTKIVYVYPWTANSAFAPSANFSNALTSASAGANPSPYASPYPSPSPALQVPPRITVAMSNLYPTGTSAVFIYPGTPATNPTASGSQVIGVTTTTTPNGGLWTTAPAITFETAPYVNTSSTTYTIVAIQQLPSSYPLGGTAPLQNPTILNTVSFVLSGFTVNGTVGTVK